MVVRRRNPYRHFLRNVHVRRAYMVFVVPLLIPFAILGLLVTSVVTALREALPEIINAIRDPESYD